MQNSTWCAELIKFIIFTEFRDVALKNLALHELWSVIHSTEHKFIASSKSVELESQRCLLGVFTIPYLTLSLI